MASDEQNVFPGLIAPTFHNYPDVSSPPPVGPRCQRLFVRSPSPSSVCSSSSPTPSHVQLSGPLTSTRSSLECSTAAAATVQAALAALQAGQISMNQVRLKRYR